MRAPSLFHLIIFHLKNYRQNFLYAIGQCLLFAFIFSLVSLRIPLETALLLPLWSLYFLIPITKDVQDHVHKDYDSGLLCWFCSLSVSSVQYFWSVCLTHALIVLTITGILATWFFCIGNLTLHHVLLISFGLFCLGIQTTFFVTTFESIFTKYHLQKAGSTLLLIIFPLFIPSFLIQAEICLSETLWMTGAILMLGTTLLTIALNSLLFFLMCVNKSNVL